MIVVVPLQYLFLLVFSQKQILNKIKSLTDIDEMDFFFQNFQDMFVFSKKSITSDESVYTF